MPAWLLQLLVTIAVKVILRILDINPYVIPAKYKGRLMQFLDQPPGPGEDPKITRGEPGSEP